MKLIFVWGAAASGRLTVAQKLPQLTGVALFHNHPVVDALKIVRQPRPDASEGGRSFV